MKILKSCLLSFVLFGLFSTTTFATNTIEKEPVSIKAQFQKFLKGMNFDEVESTTIYIDFIINDRAEILVVSTSNAKFDQTLKSKLNYKTVESGDLEYFEKYTIPITFEK